MKGIAAASLVVLALAACAKKSAPVPADAGSSGIRGKVLLGPACPGPIVASSPCPDEPVSILIRIESAATGEPMATVRSDSSGEFRIALPPGDYLLIPEPEQSGGFPHGGPVDVTVKPGEFSQVTLKLDSGLR